MTFFRRCGFKIPILTEFVAVSATYTGLLQLLKAKQWKVNLGNYYQQKKCCQIKSLIVTRPMVKEIKEGYAR